MIGTKERHFALLLKVSVEELVPQDHFYRYLERTLDLSFVRGFVQETYAHGGRPSIDPCCTGHLEHPFKTRHVKAEKDLLPLFANTGGLGYNLKSSPAYSSSHNDMFT